MSPRAASAILYAILSIAVIAVFAPARHYSFVSWDDLAMVVYNPQLHPPTLANLEHFWTQADLNLYTPLSYSLWWIIARLAGDDAAWFHAANILLHLIASAVVLGLLRAIVKSPVAALAGALLFALHPLQVEPVGWVSGMNNLLAAALSLGAIRVHFSRTHWTHSAAAFLLFVLAVLAKPTAVVAPLIAMILDVAVMKRTIRTAFLSVLPWLVVAAIFAFITRTVQPTAGAPVWQRPFDALDALGFYIRKVCCPVNFSIDYFRTPQHVWDDRLWVLTGLTFVFGTIVAVALRRRAPLVLAGGLILVAALLPLLGFVPFRLQKFSTVADRYAYLAMLGPALILGCIVARMSLRRAVFITAAIALLCAWQSSELLPQWSDTISLAKHTLAVDRDSTVGNRMMAHELAGKGDWPQAVAFYQVAFKRTPTDPELNYNLGNALLSAGQSDGAIAAYLRAIPLSPPENLPRAWNNLGIAYQQSGQRDLAEQAYRKALEIDPNDAEAASNLGRLTTR